MSEKYPVMCTSERGKDEHKLIFTFEKNEHIDLHLLKLNSALKLQKLVKKRLINWDTEAERFLLQSLIEESEK